MTFYQSFRVCHAYCDKLNLFTTCIFKCAVSSTVPGIRQALITVVLHLHNLPWQNFTYPHEISPRHRYLQWGKNYGELRGHSDYRWPRGRKFWRAVWHVQGIPFAKGFDYFPDQTQLTPHVYHFLLISNVMGKIKKRLSTTTKMEILY